MAKTGFTFIFVLFLLFLDVQSKLEDEKDDQFQSRRMGKVKIAARNDKFFLGSRYGKRFGEFDNELDLLKDGNNFDRYISQVNERNDKFFLGSRYGKRTEEIPKDMPESDSVSDVSYEYLISPRVLKPKLVHKWRWFPDN